MAARAEQAAARGWREGVGKGAPGTVTDHGPGRVAAQRPPITPI